MLRLFPCVLIPSQPELIQLPDADLGPSVNLNLISGFSISLLSSNSTFHVNCVGLTLCFHPPLLLDPLFLLGHRPYACTLSSCHRLHEFFFPLGQAALLAFCLRYYILSITMKSSLITLTKIENCLPKYVRNMGFRSAITLKIALTPSVTLN